MIGAHGFDNFSVGAQAMCYQRRLSEGLLTTDNFCFRLSVPLGIHQCVCDWCQSQHSTRFVQVALKNESLCATQSDGGAEDGEIGDNF